MDPRTGEETAAGVLQGQKTHVLSPPSTDDWVLLLARGEGGIDSAVATKGAN